jgi:hypothetical protein
LGARASTSGPTSPPASPTPRLSTPDRSGCRPVTRLRERRLELSYYRAKRNGSGHSNATGGQHDGLAGLISSCLVAKGGTSCSVVVDCRFCATGSHNPFEALADSAQIGLSVISSSCAKNRPERG